jgi:hypothetical protein
MTDLEKYFRANEGRLIDKWAHYFDVYDRHLSRFREKEVVILEIGVYHGGSLRMWQEYFGDKAKIYGIDIDPRCKDLEEKGIEIFIGSQADREFLRKVKGSVPPIDIVIDDGGHRMIQQITSFEELFGAVKKDGVYLCEDVHTSYWLRYGGGHKRRGTFIEHCKNLIDRLNAWHSEERSLPVDDFTRSVDSVHFYDSIVVIEKRERGAPEALQTGTPSFVDPPAKELPAWRRLASRGKWFARGVLRWMGFPSLT